jgi:hypothetical protein
LITNPLFVNSERNKLLARKTRQRKKFLFEVRNIAFLTLPFDLLNFEFYNIVTSRTTHAPSKRK